MMKKTLKKRVKIRLRGTVQGVGFRPFVWRLANELGLTGWVINGVRGVEIDAEGDEIAIHIIESNVDLPAPVGPIMRV